MSEEKTTVKTTSVAFRQNGYEVEVISTWRPFSFDGLQQSIVVRDPSGTKISVPVELWREAREYKV